MQTTTHGSTQLSADRETMRLIPVAQVADDLEHWLDLRGRPGSARLRRFLAEAAAGSWSVPESDLLALLRGSTIQPEPWVNAVVTGPSGEALTSPDLWLDDVAMALMVQSRQFHAGVLDWTRRWPRPRTSRR